MRSIHFIVTLIHLSLLVIAGLIWFAVAYVGAVMSGIGETTLGFWGLLGSSLILILLAWKVRSWLLGVFVPAGWSAMEFMYLSLVVFLMIVVTAGLFGFVALGIYGVVLGFLGLLSLPMVLISLALLEKLGLLGMVAPSDHSINVYSFLAVFFLLFILAESGLFSLTLFFPLSLVWEDGAIYPIVLLGWMAMSALIAGVVLRTALAGRTRTPLLYTVVVLVALGISAMFITVLYALTMRNDHSFIYLFYLGQLMLAMLGAVLIGTIRRPYQNIVVGALVIWIVVMIGGFHVYVSIQGVELWSES